MAAPDGQMYCIVLDMIETGIYYNKTIFRKLGLREPKDWNEFFAIQKKIKEAGYTPMLVDRQCLADWGVDLIFEQIYGELRDLMDLDYDPTAANTSTAISTGTRSIFLHDKGFFTPRRSALGGNLADPQRVAALHVAGPQPDRRRFRQDVRHAERRDVLEHQHDCEPRWCSDPESRLRIRHLLPAADPRRVQPLRAREGQCVIGGSAMQYCVTNAA